MQNENVRIINVKGGTSKESGKDWCNIMYTQTFEDTEHSKGDEVFSVFLPSRKPFDMFDSKYKYQLLEGYFEFRRVYDTNGRLTNKTEKVLKAVYNDKGNCILACD